MSNRSQISDQDLWSQVLPEASAEHSEQKPSPDLVGRQPQGRDLSNRPQILIRSLKPLPPWYGEFFQRVLEGPVSTKQAPQHPQNRSPPSASNRLSLATPSDQGSQPGASEEKLGEQVKGGYKMEKTESEEGFEFEEQSTALFNYPHLAAVSSPHSTSGVPVAAEALTEKEFDQTEEFEENDQFSAVWIKRERLRQAEIREAELKTEEESEGSDCSCRIVQVCFRPEARFVHGVLWPCEPLEDSDDEDEDDFE